jgi:serine/threonine protein kinase
MEFCYMVMERCTTSLFLGLERLEEFNERSLGKVLAQMLCGIVHCHDVAVMHRDVKPDNFMFGGERGEVPKLCDFNLAVVIPTGGGKKEHACGTTPFMCPEMLQGKGYNEKADLWSFGVIVYVILFGALPYVVWDVSGMKAAIASGDVLPEFKPTAQVEQTNALHGSESALELVHGLLERDPENRLNGKKALSSTWIDSAVRDCHMLGVDLQCLKQTLNVARSCGAFEMRSLQKVTVEDCVLQELRNDASVRSQFVLARDNPNDEDLDEASNDDVFDDLPNDEILALAIERKSRLEERRSRAKPWCHSDSKSRDNTSNCSTEYVSSCQNGSRNPFEYPRKTPKPMIWIDRAVPKERVPLGRFQL